MKYFNQLKAFFLSLFGNRANVAVAMNGAASVEPIKATSDWSSPVRVAQGAPRAQQMRKARKKLYNASRKHSRGKK